MAMAILATFSGGELARCVLQDDLAALTQVPGVGRKTAERLLVELRNRQELLPQDPSPVSALVPRDVTSEVEQALVALGYKHQYAHEVVMRLLASRDWASADARDTQSMLRAALQFLGQKSEVGQ
jgi:Holliday junction DNA helicase RuvA